MQAATASYYDRKVQELKTFIHDNPGAALDLRSLSRRFAVSPFHLSRIFKRLNGSTIARYVNDTRLEFSFDAVLYTRATLTEIALQYGFNNYETLGRRFKQQYKLSPGDLRQLLQFIRSCGEGCAQSKVVFLSSQHPLTESEVRDKAGIAATSPVKLFQVQPAAGRKAFNEKFTFYNA